jgi:hypothetical protein
MTEGNRLLRSVTYICKFWRKIIPYKSSDSDPSKDKRGGYDKGKIICPRGKYKRFHEFKSLKI